MPKRATIHLIVSLTLLFCLFAVLPGVFLYRLSHKIFSIPPENPRPFPFKALKTFKQKRHILKGNLLVPSVSYSEEELFAGYFENVYKENNRSILDPDLKIDPSGITISAVVYLFSIPLPKPLDAFLGNRFFRSKGRIVLYSRITAVNRVIIEDGIPTLRAKRIFIGEKEFPAGLMFWGRKILPAIFTKGFSDPIAKVVLKEKEIILYKAVSQEQDTL